jgi:hypothetical protein
VGRATLAHEAREDDAEEDPEEQTVTDGDAAAILAEIHEGLADDGVYVHPSLASGITDAQLATLVENLEALDAAGEPTYVVLYPLRDGDPFSANAQDLVARLHDTYPEPGQYLAPSSLLQYGTDGVTLDGRSYGVGGTRDGAMYDEALSVLSYEQQPTVGDAAVRVTDLLLQPPAEVATVLEEARAQSPYYSGASDDGGSTGWVVAGVVLAVVLVVALAVAWFVTRLRHTWVRDSLGAAPAFTLPASTVDRIRDAHDRRLERETREEVLALGEALDDTEIGPRHDRAAWQAALDQYDAARRVLDLAEDPDVLDVVGALVLARRGRAALAAATSGRAWTPGTGCYLNPLHGASTERRRLRSSPSSDSGSGEQAVPVCAECRADLAAGRTPDVLDVVHGGVPRHYFETDVEPWASTGYGALEPDLVQALHRTRR